MSRTVRYDETEWAVLGVLATAHHTSASDMARRAVAYLARQHGITIVDGELVRGDPAGGSNKIHGGGESTAEDPSPPLAEDPPHRAAHESTPEAPNRPT